MKQAIEPGQLHFELPHGSGLSYTPAVRRLHDYLQSLLGAGFPPSLGLAVVRPGGTVLEAAGGRACTWGEVVPTTIGTSYDLASLTKVICTVTLVLLAKERGTLALGEPVVRWLPHYPHQGTTLRHLLTHTAGLAEHRPFFRTLKGRHEIERAVMLEAAAAVPDGVVRYSDLGYMLLGWVLEAALAGALDRLFADMIAAPLGLERACFRPSPQERRQTAATELDGDQRLEPGLVWGEVHDGNAHALGGVAGHAGLFSPLRDVAGFARALLAPGEHRFLSRASAELLAAEQARSGDDVRGLGWRLEPAVWGDWPAGTIWHTGFTGTSLLVAPAACAAVVLLTNAVHPRRRLEELGAVRAEVHRLVFEAVA